MMTQTIPLGMPEDLLQEVRDTASATHLAQADVMRQSMRLGLPLLRRAIPGKKEAGLHGRTLADVVRAPQKPLNIAFPRMQGQVNLITLPA